MENSIKFELKAGVVEELQTFSQLLKKDVNTILNEALEQYFENEQKKILEKNLGDESALTNFHFDEFWEDMDI